MVSIYSIISNNNATFYNNRTGGRLRIWPRITIFIMISPCIALIVSDNLTNFINSINTISSILLGFGFSVLFYIAGGNDETNPHEQSFEKSNRKKRIRLISKELFHNISYFVMIASAALAFSMVVIAPEARSEWFAKEIVSQALKIAPQANDYIWWIQFFFRSLFFFLVIEAGYTFARIVGRVNYLFEERMKERDS